MITILTCPHSDYFHDVKTCPERETRTIEIPDRPEPQQPIGTRVVEGWRCDCGCDQPAHCPEKVRTRVELPAWPPVAMPPRKWPGPDAEPPTPLSHVVVPSHTVDPVCAPAAARRLAELSGAVVTRAVAELSTGEAGCPACLKVVAVNRDGLLRVHNHQTRSRCVGSGREPTNIPIPQECESFAVRGRTFRAVWVNGKFDAAWIQRPDLGWEQVSAAEVKGYVKEGGE